MWLSTAWVSTRRPGRLTRSNQLNGNREPADLAFLAMAQHRLNQVETARATLSGFEKS